jgi:hypothetical protein
MKLAVDGGAEHHVGIPAMIWSRRFDEEARVKR